MDHLSFIDDDDYFYGYMAFGSTVPDSLELKAG
jgi:hypothetical protein